jgi:6-phosphogluconate dehydrogenase
MELGMIGLGKMGGNMTIRLVEGGHRVVAYDVVEAAVRSAEAHGAQGAFTLAEVVAQLPPPRTIWLMLPAGQITEEAITTLAGLLSPGDTLIDGGNSCYKDSQRRAEWLQEKGLHFLDVGTSGGIWGLREGYCLMIGGPTDVVNRHRPIFEALAPAADRGWGHVGANGAGHFTKMVHNGIEYGLMQAYAEGFAILQAKVDFDLHLAQIAEIWRHGSVVRSWLLDLAAAALVKDETLKTIKGWVADSGEGRWTAFEAIDLDVPAPVITLSLQQRLRSRLGDSFSDKLIAALRTQFGGHPIIRSEE